MERDNSKELLKMIKKRYDLLFAQMASYFFRDSDIAFSGYDNVGDSEILQFVCSYVETYPEFLKLPKAQKRLFAVELARLFIVRERTSRNFDFMIQVPSELIHEIFPIQHIADLASHKEDSTETSLLQTLYRLRFSELLSVEEISYAFSIPFSELKQYYASIHRKDDRKEDSASELLESSRYFVPEFIFSFQ